MDMKRRMVALAASAAVLFMATGCTAQEKKPELKTLKDKVSYGIGMNIGKDFKQQDIDVDVNLLARGIKDALAGGEAALSEEQMREAFEAFQKDLVAKQEAKSKELTEKNLKTGEAFLAENAKQEGVVTLPSGLQYKVLEEGSGKSPAATDTVTVNYRGTLIDGSEFDSSFKRGEPATFPVSGVIPGWTEALQLMKEGAKWQLVIPPALAYGERGAGPVIGPNATLVFEVELVKVQ
jgi:FKBP-type peptidyl-prolyl cis-trans isomerase FklB